MYRDAGIPLIDCVIMMSLTPTRIIGLGLRKSIIEIGKDADIIVFDGKSNILGTICTSAACLG